MTEQKKQNILVRQSTHGQGKCTATAAAVGRLSVLNDKVPTALCSNNSSRHTVVFLSLLFYFYSFAGRLRWDRPTDNYHYFNRTVFEGTKGYIILYTRYLTTAEYIIIIVIGAYRLIQYILRTKQRHGCRHRWQCVFDLYINDVIRSLLFLFLIDRGDRTPLVIFRGRSQ